MSKWTDLIPRPRSKFYQVICFECGNEQIIFSTATTVVKCNVCNSILSEPTSGKAVIHGKIVNIFD